MTGMIVAGGVIVVAGGGLAARQVYRERARQARRTARAERNAEDERRWNEATGRRHP